MTRAQWVESRWDGLLQRKLKLEVDIPVRSSIGVRGPRDGMNRRLKSFADSGCPMAMMICGRDDDDDTRPTDGKVGRARGGSTTMAAAQYGRIR